MLYKYATEQGATAAGMTIEQVFNKGKHDPRLRLDKVRYGDINISPINHDGKIVGFYRPTTSLAGNPAMGALYVLPEYRNKGIGKKVVQDFYDKNPNMVYITTDTNKASQALAKSIGLQYSKRPKGNPTGMVFENPMNINKQADEEAPAKPKSYIRMKRIVGSSNVQSVGYSKRNEEMAVRFKSTPQRYLYSGVPLSVYEDMLVAPSKGKYMHQNVKGYYPYRREDYTSDKYNQEGTMPAVSRKQQQYFGWLHSKVKSGDTTGMSEKDIKTMNSMSPEQIRAYAATKHKGLPVVIKKEMDKNTSAPKHPFIMSDIAPEQIPKAAEMDAEMTKPAFLHHLEVSSGI